MTVSTAKIAPGIYRTETGFRAFVRVQTGDGQSKLVPKRFPKTATLTMMKQWREDQRVGARARPRPKADHGTLAADMIRYLKQVAAMPTLAWRERDLNTWKEIFGDVNRSQLTTEMIRGQLQAWRSRGPVLRFNPKTKVYTRVQQPLSASACNHRRTALLHLWSVLDGRGAPNPVRAVPPFDEPPPAPRAQDLDFLEAAIARMKNDRDRARASVLLWTAVRGNSELGKMKPEHVKLADTAGECHVPTGKGGRRYRFVPLNAKGVAAWKAFAKARAWGPYDRHKLRVRFQSACKREAVARGLTVERVRPYDLRHSLATAYLKAGADLADVQDLLGHTTTRMTRRYAPMQRQKLMAAAKALEA